MNRNTITIHTIDVDLFNRQRGLIAKMVSDLNRGESAFAVKSDAPELSGILAILDEINDQNNLDGVDKRANESPCTDMGTTLECPDYDNSGPDCPGCGTPGGCDTCEYTSGPVEYVNVVFLRDQDGGDIFAAFPNQEECNDCIGSYAHVGQCSAASLAYCADCDEVTDPGDYADLAGELFRIGYKLRVVSKASIKSDSEADTWACTSCAYSVHVHQYEYDSIGTPYCSDCDQEMECV